MLTVNKLKRARRILMKNRDDRPIPVLIAEAARLSAGKARKKSAARSYVDAAQAALGRAIDQEIIAAMARHAATDKRKKMRKRKKKAAVRRAKR